MGLEHFRANVFVPFYILKRNLEIIGSGAHLWVKYENTPKTGPLNANIFQIIGNRNYNTFNHIIFY